MEVPMLFNKKILPNAFCEIARLLYWFIFVHIKNQIELLAGYLFEIVRFLWKTVLFMIEY